MKTAYAIKTEIVDLDACEWAFPRQKTMYGGKQIRVGSTIYVFASENEGGTGLVARGVVTASAAVPRVPGLSRQTPRVSITVECTGSATRRLGRAELKTFDAWKDGRPQTELNFKFYRQATNKIVGLSEAASAFLACCFA